MWLGTTYRSGPFYEVLKTASGEIAVLLFVFPLIDMLGKSEGKTSERNWLLVWSSFGVGFVFILLAGFFSRMERESEEEERE